MRLLRSQTVSTEIANFLANARSEFGEAAVREHLGTGDERSLVGSEEQRQTCDLFGPADTFERHTLHPARRNGVRCFFRHLQLAEERSGGGARTNGDYADAAGRKFRRQSPARRNALPL
jgi:hypothetical protein